MESGLKLLAILLWLPKYLLNHTHEAMCVAQFFFFIGIDSFHYVLPLVWSSVLPEARVFQMSFWSLETIVKFRQVE